MPDSPSNNSTPTFFSDDSNNHDSGLPDFSSPSPSSSPSHKPTGNFKLDSGSHDLEEQMSKSEPLYTKNSTPSPNSSPSNSFSSPSSLPPHFSNLARSEDGEISLKPKNDQADSTITETTPNQDLSLPPASELNKTDSTLAQPKNDVIPLYTPPRKDPPPPPAIKPPTPASSSSDVGGPSRLATMIFALLAVMAITASTFLYLQNKALKQQLNILQSTQAGRELPTPTPTGTDLESTPSAIPTSSQDASFSAFTDLDRIISIARQESSTAQLLMITSDDIVKSPAAVYRYWFRTGPNQQTYFYIQHAKTGEPQLYTQATISPDNNIPDLIPLHESNDLGIDDLAAHDIAWTEINKELNYQRAISVTAKFIRSRSSNPQATDVINLWQLTYTVAGRPNIIVQIDANTSQIVFSNL